MIGIFDSGDGGLAAAREVRRLFQKEDIVLLADRKNAPYGTKTEEELISLVKEDIRRLSEMGCEKILVACCTASTVFPLLSEGEQQICLPIIHPTAEAVCGSAHTAVIATERTVNSHAFSSEILRIYPKTKVNKGAAPGQPCGAGAQSFNPLGNLRGRDLPPCRTNKSDGSRHAYSRVYAFFTSGRRICNQTSRHKNNQFSKGRRTCVKEACFNT